MIKERKKGDIRFIITLDKNVMNDSNYSHVGIKVMFEDMFGDDLKFFRVERLKYDPREDRTDWTGLLYDKIKRDYVDEKEEEEEEE